MLSLFTLLFHFPRFGHDELLQLRSCVTFYMPLPVFGALPRFLAPEGSFCTLPAPALKSVISPRSPRSLCWRMVFRNQDLGAGCAHCYWSVMLVSSLSFSFPPFLPSFFSLFPPLICQQHEDIFPTHC